MKNIKVGELNALKKSIKEEMQTVEFKGLNINVLRYLPISKKIRLIIESHMSASDDGVFDLYLFEIYFKKALVEMYSNINLPTKIMDAYDLVMETGVYDIVYENIPEREKKSLKDFKDKYLQSEKEKTDRQNSIVYVVKEFLKNIESKLPPLEDIEAFIKSLQESGGKLDI